ncbi:conserved Plasmodium protein, unknown function [Plasmodium gallinaceum]|uniref:Uncharacterized protein n=1 Tax=Plasmodium gallinaceum TaxID=5849 RepID=A0A1J1GRK5_PLAGA|nr:conserved Plasmodium protein, unknown function [Plasmodium gallinaceum]CRG93920.1 conserved Plasmodium protein, unknown function [Plasmodium gallinaceum]
MCIRRIPGFHEKIHRSIFRRKNSGPSPLYKTPLRHIWAIFFYIDVFILYIYVLSFFFSIITRHECFEIFPIVFLTAVNLISSFFIDFFFLLIKDKEVVSEDEIILSTFFTILCCIIKIIVNVYIFYTSLNYFGKIFDSSDNDIKTRCHTSVTKGILLNFIVITAFPFVETYIESILTFFSIVHFKSQVQKYEMII